MVAMRHKSRFSLLNVLMLALNIPLALLLVAAYLADVVSPASMVCFAFAGLVYPWLLLLNIFFVIYWPVFPA